MSTLIDRDRLADMPWRTSCTSPWIPDQHVVASFDLDDMHIQATISFGGEILFATAYSRDNSEILAIWSSDACK